MVENRDIFSKHVIRSHILRSKPWTLGNKCVLDVDAGTMGRRNSVNISYSSPLIRSKKTQVSHHDDGKVKLSSTASAFSL